MSFGEPRVAEVVAASAEYFDVTVGEIMGPRQTRTVAAARQVAMAVVRKVTERSWPEIGTAFGRDHTTVIEAARRVRNTARLTKAAEAVTRAVTQPSPVRSPGCTPTRHRSRTQVCGLSVPRGVRGQ